MVGQLPPRDADAGAHDIGVHRFDRAEHISSDDAMEEPAIVPDVSSIEKLCAEFPVAVRSSDPIGSRGPQRPRRWQCSSVSHDPPGG